MSGSPLNGAVRQAPSAVRFAASSRQAAQTRRDIEAAADKLFRQRGYVGTSMPAIAAEAGVVVETVYRAFGSKAGLFKAVIEAALAGGSERAERPPAERPAIRAVIEEPDPSRKLELYAATQPGVHGRSRPAVPRTLVAAADSDPELRDVLDGLVKASARPEDSPRS